MVTNRKTKNNTWLGGLTLVAIMLFSVSVLAQATPATTTAPKSTAPGTTQATAPTPTTVTEKKPSVWNSLSPSKKQCPYIGKTLYKPFSNISTDFALFKAFEFETGNGKSTSKECIKIVGSVDRFFFLIFKIFVGITSVLAVIYIAIAGVTMIIEQANPSKKLQARALLMRALQGLVLSIIAWVVLFTINNKLTNFSVDEILTQSEVRQAAQNLAGGGAASNIYVLAGTVAPGGEIYSNPGGQSATGGAVPEGAGNCEFNQYSNTLTPEGTTRSSQTTIFGYKDGDGTVGFTGDQGIGNGAISHVSGYTNYTGNVCSQGVAVPSSWIIRDFGGYTGTKNSAYALFYNGRHLGNFPVVDTSYAKLDFTFGLVKNNIDGTVRNSNSWSSSQISYKPLKNFFATNPRLKNPMIEDKVVTCGTTRKSISKCSPSEISAAVQRGEAKVIYQ